MAEQDIERLDTRIDRLEQRHDDTLTAIFNSQELQRQAVSDIQGDIKVIRTQNKTTAGLRETCSVRFVRVEKAITDMTEVKHWLSGAWKIVAIGAGVFTFLISVGLGLWGLLK